MAARAPRAASKAEVGAPPPDRSPLWPAEPAVRLLLLLLALDASRLARGLSLALELAGLKITSQRQATISPRSGASLRDPKDVTQQR